MLEKSRVTKGRSVRIQGRLFLKARGPISIGAHTSIAGGEAGVSLTAEATGEILVEEDCSLETQVSIHAAALVHIGKRCHIGAGTLIRAERAKARGALSLLQPVIIEADVIIGPRVIILPGVRIGWGSLIGPGVLVARDVPPLSYITGEGAQPASNSRETSGRGPFPEARLASLSLAFPRPSFETLGLVD